MGAGEGLPLGVSAEGNEDGTEVKLQEGEWDKTSSFFLDGSKVGVLLGIEDGDDVGLILGIEDGNDVGLILGIEDGDDVGLILGIEDGDDEGLILGIDDGLGVGPEYFSWQ